MNLPNKLSLMRIILVPVTVLFMLPINLFGWQPEGWNNWGKAQNELTAYYAEYLSSGIGANPEKRAKWSHQLTDIKDYNPNEILKGSDEWEPIK